MAEADIHLCSCSIFITQLLVDHLMTMIKITKYNPAEKKTILGLNKSPPMLLDSPEAGVLIQLTALLGALSVTAI